MRILSAVEIANLSTDSAKYFLGQYTALNSSLVQQNQRQAKIISDLMAKLGEKDQDALFRQETLAKLQAMVFGDKSERRSNTDEMETGGEHPQKKERTKFGRRVQPELPIVEIRHELSVEERKCTSCGGELSEWEGQFEKSEMIQVIPASFKLEKHLRQKYRCKCGGCIKTAPGPLKMKEGSRYTPEFAIEVAVGKYQNHLPLTRQVTMMRAVGLEVESQTLYSQIDDLAFYLKPIVENIRQYIRQSGVIHADETPWKNLAKKKWNRPNKRYQIWEMATHDAVYMEIYDSRSGDTAEKFLGGIKGVLLCDGLASYNRLQSSDLMLAACWAHVRRKFIEAEKYPESELFLKLIRRLYRVERHLKGKPPDIVSRWRGRLSSAIVKRIYALLLEFKTFLPQSSLGIAINYALNEWDGLTVFLMHPGVPIDNNLAERNLRGPVVGRKNHYGSKSKRGTEVAALFYTIIETCKMNGVDPRTYLRETIHAVLTKQIVRMPWERPVSKTVDSETVAASTYSGS